MVNSIDNCDYDYLEGWKFTFWATKTDTNDFNTLQELVSGVHFSDAKNAYAFHGAPDIFIRKQGGTTLVLSESSEESNRESSEASNFRIRKNR